MKDLYVYTFFVAVSGLDWGIVIDAFNWQEKEQDIRQCEMKDSFMILLVASGEMRYIHIK